MRILGRIFKLTDNTSQDITAKIGTAWSKYHRLKHILRARTALDHRLRILKACIIQSLLWSCESWHITRKNLQRIRGAEMAMLRSMIPPPQNSHPDMTTSQKIEEHKAHIRSILQKHKYISADRTWVKRYHGWAGHISRLPPQRWARQMLEFKNVAWWRQQQQTDTGHRHTKTRGNISRWENALVRYHQDHSDWGKKARDRFDWPRSFAAFEKATFGPNSPHIFPDSLQHPEQDSKTLPTQSGESRKRLREGDAQQRAGKRHQIGARGNHGEETGRGPRKGNHHHQNTLEESTNLPLASLLNPQDVRSLRKPKFFAVSSARKASASRESEEKQEPGKGDGKGDGATLSGTLAGGHEDAEEAKKNCFEAIDDEEGKATSTSSRPNFRAKAGEGQGGPARAPRQPAGRRVARRTRPSSSRIARHNSPSTSTTSSSSSTSTSTSTSSRPSSLTTSRTRPATTTTTTTTTGGSREREAGAHPQRWRQQQTGAAAEASKKRLPGPSRSAQAGATAAAATRADAAQHIPDSDSAAAPEQQQQSHLAPGAAATAEAAPAESPPVLPRLDEGGSCHDERNGRDERADEGTHVGTAIQTHRQPADGVRHDARKRRHDDGRSQGYTSMALPSSSSSAAAPPPAQPLSKRHPAAGHAPHDAGATATARQLRRVHAMAPRVISQNKIHA